MPLPPLEDAPAGRHPVGRRLLAAPAAMRVPVAGSWKRTAVAAVVAIGTITGAAASSQASTNPYPSQQQVDAAKKAVTTASATVASLQAQYNAASARLAVVQDEVSAAAEVYDEAQIRLQASEQAAQDAAAAAAKAQQGADSAALVVRRYAAQLYQSQGSLSGLEAFLSASGPQEVADTAVAMAAIGDARATALQQAATSANLAASTRAEAQQAQAQEAAAAKAAQAARADAQAKADAATQAASAIGAQQQQMVVQLASLQKTSVAVEQARQAGLKAAAEAAAAAAARKKAAEAAAAAERAAQRAAEEAAARRAAEASAGSSSGSSSSGSGSGGSSSGSGSGSGSIPVGQHAGVAAVLAYARAQVGKWYQWGGAGPNTFDCSGLTMMAWQQAGVYMPHGSQAQYNLTRHIPISQLQPGDLVFFGVSGPANHHVGIYVGGGMMIEAPYTGAQVRYSSIYRSDLVPFGGRP